MNYEKKLKTIAFDLDTKILKERYTKGDWHNAYSDIRAFIEKKHFKHVQGSVYDSNIKMNDFELGDLVNDMCRNFKEWLPQCIKSIRGYDQPMMIDYTEQVRDKYHMPPHKTMSQNTAKSTPFKANGNHESKG